MDTTFNGLAYKFLLDEGIPPLHIDDMWRLFFIANGYRENKNEGFQDFFKDRYGITNVTQGMAAFRCEILGDSNCPPIFTGRSFSNAFSNAFG